MELICCLLNFSFSALFRFAVHSVVLYIFYYVYIIYFIYYAYYFCAAFWHNNK